MTVIKIKNFIPKKRQPSVVIKDIDSLSVEVNSVDASLSLTGDYVAEVGDNITITATLVEGESIDYGDAIIKLPIVKHGDGQPTNEEIYFSSTVSAGVLTATGTISASGDWKLLVSRINKALNRINAGWNISGEDVGILV